MRFFSASFDTILWRFYLMMVVVIAPFVLGVPFLAILALPIFLSTMLGVSFKKPSTGKMKNKAVIIKINQQNEAA